MARTHGIGCLGCFLCPYLHVMSMNIRTSVALTCPSATRRSLSMGHFSPSTAAAPARRFEVAAVYAPGIIIISSWVPGVLEAKSWGTRIGLGTTVGDLLAAPCSFLWCCCCCDSVAMLLLLIELLLATTNSSAAACRCLSVAAVALR